MPSTGDLRATILTVDDDAIIHQSLKLVLGADYRLFSASGAGEALGVLQRQEIQLVLLDVQMPEVSGLELLKMLRQRYPEIPVIMLSGVQEIDTVVEAIRGGASDYIIKGREDTNLELKRKIANLLELKAVRARAKRLEDKVRSQESEYELVGASSAMVKLRTQIAALKGHGATVLITGESGSGKELVARLLSTQEGDEARPFHALNCAAIAKDLAESELFGHEKGAFTHALQKREGWFVASDGGDLFLDEVGELPVPLQAKLLRVLQEKCVTPVGSHQSIPVNVRVIAATNRNLEEMVRAGEFREDLYYRLSVFPIQVPSLRERREDIPLLVSYLMKKIGCGHIQVSSLAMKKLIEHDWPGNVRVLKHTIERAYFLALNRGADRMDLEDLHLRGDQLREAAAMEIPHQFLPRRLEDLTPEGRSAYVDWMEKVYLTSAYHAASKNKGLLATRLNLSRDTIFRRFKALRIGQPESEVSSL